jgi:hypothetical protein
MFRFSVKNFLQTPQLIPTIPASSWIFRWRSSWMSSRKFSTFSVVLLVLGRPERLHLQLTLDRSWNVNAIRKSQSGVKNVLQKPLTKHLKCFDSGFTKCHAKLYADTLLDFDIHHRQNETRTRKSNHIETMHVHSTVSRGRLMQRACRSVNLVSPFILFHWGSYNNKSLGAFWCHHLYPCTCFYWIPRLKYRVVGLITKYCRPRGSNCFPWYVYRCIIYKKLSTPSHPISLFFMVPFKLWSMSAYVSPVIVFLLWYVVCRKNSRPITPKPWCCQKFPLHGLLFRFPSQCALLELPFIACNIFERSISSSIS